MEMLEISNISLAKEITVC